MASVIACPYQAELTTLAEKLVEGTGENLAMLVEKEGLALAVDVIEAVDPSAFPESLEAPCIVTSASADPGPMLVVFTRDACRTLAASEAEELTDAMAASLADLAGMFFEAASGIFGSQFEAHWTITPQDTSVLGSGLAESPAMTDQRAWLAIGLRMTVGDEAAGQIWLFADHAVGEAAWGPLEPDDAGQSPAEPADAAAGPTTENAPGDPAAVPEPVRRALRIRVPLIVRLGEKKLPLSEILRLGVGSIIEFEKSYSELLELMANDRVIGSGEAVKIGERFGLKVMDIVEPRVLIRNLGRPAPEA